MGKVWNRWTAIALIAALLLPTAALAEDTRVSLKELREQTPAFWQGEYVNRKGRSVRFCAPILMPESDTFPVARVVRHASSEKALAPYAAGLEDEALRAQSSTLSLRMLQRIDAQGELLQEQGYTYSIGSTEAVYHHLWAQPPAVDAAAVRAQQQEITLEDAGDQLAALVRQLYGEEYGVLIDQAATNGTPVVKEKRNAVAPLDLGEHTGKGSYDIQGILTMNGIPLLGGPKYHQGFGLRYQEHLLSYSIHGAEFMNYLSDDCFVFYGDAYSVQEMLCEDVPLCSFEKIKETVEALIERDKVQHVYALYLGWVCWLDPSIQYPTKKSGHAEGLCMPYLATPVWLVECCYASSTGRDFSEYPQREGNGEPYDYRSQAWGVELLMINAQTAEAFDPWDESSRRKFAPDVMTW